MKRGFQGAPRPLLPSMLLVATNPIAGQEHAAQAQTQPLPPPPPIPSPTPTPIPTSTSPPPIIPSPTPPPIPTPTSPPPPPPETEPPTDEHINEEQSPVHHHFSPSQAQAPSHMPTDDLLQTVPNEAIPKKVKKLEGFLKRRNLVLTDSEDEDLRFKWMIKVKLTLNISSKQGLVHLLQTKAHLPGRNKSGKISPNTLEFTKPHLKVIEQDSTAGDNKEQREGKISYASVKKLQRRQRNISYKKKLAL
ncbi:hypothetical protein Tco_0463054 [Tanacetum coccineum]